MSKDIKKPVRPFSLKYDEAKSKIVSAINEATQIHGVPFYLLESMVGEMLAQVRENARTERERAKAAHDKGLAEFMAATAEQNESE